MREMGGGRWMRVRVVGLARTVPLSEIFALSGGRTGASSSVCVDNALLWPVKEAESEAVDPDSVRVRKPES